MQIFNIKLTFRDQSPIGGGECIIRTLFLTFELIVDLLGLEPRLHESKSCVLTTCTIGLC